MITGTNELNVWLYGFVGKKCNTDQLWNNGRSLCECKKRNICEKDYIWNSATCSFQSGKYLSSIVNDSAITRDEIIDADAKSNNEETKTFPKSFTQDNVTDKT